MLITVIILNCSVNHVKRLIFVKNELENKYIATSKGDKAITIIIIMKILDTRIR